MRHQKQNEAYRQLASENMRLKEIIAGQRNNQAQTEFLEKLVSSAMSGFCSQPWAADEPQKAAELAIKAGEYAIEKIIKAVAKANKEEEAKVNAQIKRMAEESEKHRLDLEGVSLSSDDHAQVSKIQNGAEQVFHPETN